MSADRNLLFGILALEMDFIHRDTLITALNAWVLDKAKPLGQILQEQGALRADEHDLLEALVVKHLQRHANDPEKSLASVHSIGSMRQPLQEVADPDLQTSLSHLFCRHDTQPNPPSRLETICMQAMTRHPKDCFATAIEIAAELEHWREAKSISDYGERWTEKLGRWLQRHRLMVATAVIVTILAGAVISVTAIRQYERTSQKAREQSERNLHLARQAVHKTVTKITADLPLKEADYRQLRYELLQGLVPIYEDLVRQRPNDAGLRAEWGRALHSLALRSDEIGKYVPRQVDFKQVLDIFSRLATEYPSDPQYPQEVAACYTNMGNVLWKQRGQWQAEQAEPAYSHAVKIWQQLTVEYPNVCQYRQELARTHCKLAEVLGALQRPGEAEESYRVAAGILTQLAAEFPAEPQHRQELAACQTTLGDFLREQGKQDVPETRNEAEAAYRTALNLTAQLTADFPTVPQYRQELARSYHCLALVLADLGKITEAETAHHDALKIQAQLATDFPTVPSYRQDLARSHHRLAIVLAHLDELSEAEIAFQDALKIQTELAAAFPTTPDYQNDLAMSLVHGANLARCRNETALARQLLEQALPHHLAALRTTNSLTYRQSFRDNREVLAWTLVHQGDHTGSAAAAEQMIQTRVDQRKDQYTAARIFSRCVPLAERDAKLTAIDRQGYSQAYTSCALAALRQAVQLGYDDLDRIQKDTDLDPLRSHPEFQKLLKELEPIAP